MRRWLVLLMLSVAMVVPAGSGTAQAQTPTAQLVWTPCPPAGTCAATPIAASDTGLECATLQAPLDYDNPAGEQITIGMNRLPARDPANRIGSLIFQPGRSWRKRFPDYRSASEQHARLHPGRARSLRPDRHGSSGHGHQHAGAL